MSTTTPSRVGIVGAGTICREAHLPVLTNLFEADLAFVADVDGERARRTTRGYAVRGITVSDPEDVPECDACLLAVPVGVRDPYIAELGRRGTAMFTEKPFATDEKTHQRRLSAAGDTPITCNYTRLQFAATQQLRALVASGLFGSLERVSLSHDLVGPTNVSPGSYRLNPRLSGGGILAETGCHAVSQLVSILGGYDLRVASSEFRWADDIEVEVDARLRAVPADQGHLPGGAESATVELTLSRVTPCGTHGRLVFEDATVTFDPVAADANVTVELPNGAQRSVLAFAPAEDDVTTFLQAFSQEWRTLLRAVRETETWSDERRERETGLAVTSVISDIYGDQRGEAAA
ncbi:MAG: Gfo/Idh/MocA family protein [Halobacteriota archaeon]